MSMASASASQRQHRMATACFLAVAVLALWAAPTARGARPPPRAGAAARAQAQQQANASASAADEFLAPHNQARAAVGVAPLRWSGDLAAAAARTASQQQQRQARCGFADMAGSPYGANQGWASYPARPAEVVASWVAEGRFYTHANNSCAAGQQCGTYTQVVWRRTAELGCAQASCTAGTTLTICLYNPHGNVQGQSPY
ncbi:STS14 protein-like [Oryza brachyantha]|uniref:STS14 protein-like n=1 Tax=Oryza brachyantha TaxID=4533 RepID=UPI001ADAE160|nr:STS14 protein-like [Oryza brachyantha]